MDPAPAAPNQGAPNPDEPIIILDKHGRRWWRCARHKLPYGWYNLDFIDKHTHLWH
jgi:hypothetical protein